MFMFIQMEETPNPNAVKFLPGYEFNERSPIYYKSKEDCNSELARRLLDLNFVEAVFFGRDFVTISKESDSDWNLIKPELLMIMMEYFSAKLPVFDAFAREVGSISFSEIEKQIIEIIDSKVRPSVAMDGGDIIYKGFEDGVVLLELHGACSGCPSSSVTLKNGIERMLKHYVPEVRSVESV
jgi:Fe-S cluster biogenesis protein NfuA